MSADEIVAEATGGDYKVETVVGYRTNEGDSPEPLSHTAPAGGMIGPTLVANTREHERTRCCDVMRRLIKHTGDGRTLTREDLIAALHEMEG